MTTGGEPAAAQRRAAEQVPAGVAGQVEVEEDERRVGGPRSSASRGVLGRRRLGDLVALARRWRATIRRRLSSSSTSRTRRHAVGSSAIALDRDVGAGVVGASTAGTSRTPASAAMARARLEQLLAEAEAGDDDARRAAGGDQRDRLADERASRARASAGRPRPIGRWTCPCPQHAHRAPRGRRRSSGRLGPKVALKSVGRIRASADAVADARLGDDQVAQRAVGSAAASLRRSWLTWT